MIEVSFDYFSSSLLLGGVVGLTSSFIIFLHGPKSPINQAWMFLYVFVSSWSIGYFSMINATSEGVAIASNVLLHYAAVFIPSLFFVFALTLIDKVKEFKNVIVAFFGISLFFTFIIQTDLFLLQTVPKGPFSYAPTAGPLYGLFALFFFGAVGYSVYLINLARKSSQDKLKRYSLKLITFSTLFGFLGGGSVFLLTFNINIAPWLLILFSLHPALSAYAILRYGLFNIKLITTEFAVFLLWLIIIFWSIFIADSLVNIFVGLIALVLTVFGGVVLLITIFKEVKQREELEKLSQKLQYLNSELQKLDQMKTEFLSLASHQLRTPLTSIKGYSSMILEGSFGKISKKVRQPVKRIFESSSILAKVISDLLDISKIEQGGMQYEMLTFSLSSMVQSVVDEQKFNAKKKDIRLSFDMKHSGKYALKGDQVKLRQVVMNLVDNAIKYTNKGGWVKVSLSKRKQGDKRFVELVVADNGRGISEDMIKKLFQKFSRGDAGKKTNAAGSGLGLYLAKQIIKAHAGDLTVESEGDNKGSRFIVTFAQDY